MSFQLNDYPKKLTAVTMQAGGHKVQTFVQCYMIDGKAVLPGDMVTAIHNKLNLRRGDGYTCG